METRLRFKVIQLSKLYEPLVDFAKDDDFEITQLIEIIQETERLHRTLEH